MAAEIGDRKMVVLLKAHSKTKNVVHLKGLGGKLTACGTPRLSTTKHTKYSQIIYFCWVKSWFRRTHMLLKTGEKSLTYVVLNCGHSYCQDFWAGQREGLITHWSH